VSTERIIVLGLVGIAACWIPLFTVGSFGLMAIIGPPVITALIIGLLLFNLMRWLVG